MPLTDEEKRIARLKKTAVFLGSLGAMPFARWLANAIAGRYPCPICGTLVKRPQPRCGNPKCGVRLKWG